MYKNKPDEKITIITNDNDYLQLLKYPSVSLVNLKQEDLVKRSLGNPEWDLLRKIILGDPSDNIPKCLERCGEKTLLKYLNNRPELNRVLQEREDTYKQFKINQVLIDFEKIPKLMTEDLLAWCSQNL
jgi:5'-3' exonuclease